MCAGVVDSPFVKSNCEYKDLRFDTPSSAGDNERVPTATPPMLPMQQFGRYLLVAKLAEGGMAEIHLAVEEMARAGRRFVIIKRIHDQFADDPDYVEYFLTEGKLALKLSHPNLPMAYELGQIGATHYLAMEFIRGPTLLDLLRVAHRRGGKLSVRSAVTIARAVAAALDHAHTLRDVDGEPLDIIHRDVTPQNTIVGYDGTIKLIDFGIAQATVQSHRTATGVVKGKFSYLAPEQFDRKSKVDQRSDLFSLGVMLHESLLGQVLFRAKTDRETIRRVLRGPIPDPSKLRKQVPASLGRVVLRALARNPDERYPTAAGLLGDLEYVAEREGLGVSVLQLREEVRALYGSPEQFVIPAITQVDSIDIDFDEITGASNTPATAGIAADSDLRYFLARAGVVVPSKRPRRLRTTTTDVEFSELLARLHG